MSFDVTRAIFNQVDANRDGAIDQSEFSQWVSGGGAGFASASSAESASFGGGFGSSAAFEAGSAGAGFGGAVFESASYGAGAAGAGAGGAILVSGGQAFDSGASAVSSQAVVQHYAADSHGNFIDSNPEIIRRPAAGGVHTYTQNVAVRFLQPPPVPPPGPIIIREVRPPQPPPPPPLRLRQQAPPLPTPPPLVLRERPPQPPPVIPSQTIIRRLAAIPVPPRSVIIERLPPLPPKPRDIIIERWVPYGPAPRRRTIIQRAGAAVQYARPRNVIIQYEPVAVRVVRQFHRLGVVAANPAAYYNTYGATLLDAGALLQQARAAGVVEDISAPGVVGYGYGSASYGQEAIVAGSLSGFEGAGFGGASSFESAGFSVGGGEAGFGLGGGAGFSSSSFESGSFGGATGGFDVVGTAFRNADANADGTLDQVEFNRFVQQGL